MVSVLADREQGALVYERGSCYPILMEESQHFRDMLVERHIPREWVERALLAPDKTEDHEDGTRHYLRRISEHGGRWLRLVVNAETQRAVTVFFDRRLESQK